MGQRARRLPAPLSLRSRRQAGSADHARRMAGHSLAGVDEAAREIFYVSSEASPLERQLYRIGLNGKHKELLTQAARARTPSRWARTCEYYLDTASSLTAAARDDAAQARRRRSLPCIARRKRSSTRFCRPRSCR